jgi:hypothetical protein
MKTMIPKRDRRHRLAASLMDVVFGTAILSFFFVPVMQLMGQSNRQLGKLVLNEILLFEAERAMHRQRITLCDPAEFDRAIAVIRQAVTDNETEQIRLRIEQTQDRDIANLLTMVCTAYQDTNSNGQLDPDEAHQILRTQWCRP